jgi:capsular exopolysaccharide synthesis family protein
MATLYQNSEENPAFRPDDFAYEGAGQSVSIAPMLRNMLSIARRNLWLIAAIVAAFLAAAAVLTLLTTPKYTANSSIEIADQTEQVLGEHFSEQSNDQTNSWDIDRFLTTQVSILKSRALSERVAKRLNLYSDARFFSAMQADRDEYKTDTERRDAVLDLLQSNLEISLPGDSRIAQISFTSTDAQMSARVANAFAEEFIQSNLQRRFDSSSYARTFVQQQLGQARSRLEASEQNLNTYAKSVGLIRMRDPSTTTDNNSNSANSSVTTSSLMQLNQAANEAKTQRLAAEARWNAERAQPLLSSPAALASPIVQDLAKRRSEAQSALDDAKTRYLGDHPLVQRLTSNVQNIDAQLTTAATQARNSVRAEYTAAASSEERLRAQVGELEGATLREQDRSVRYNTLAREADTNRSIYDGLLQRYRELNAAAGITASNISVIDVAEAPNQPSSPNPVLNLTIALLLGLLTAAAIVFLKDQLDDRIRIPEEVEDKVGVHLLGVIPEAKGDDPLEALRDPKSVVAEGYSALRNSLLYSTREGLPQLMLVTSAQASEGKSTTSFAVARSLSLIGKRTLLVDADLRRPSIHKLADVSNTSGLSDVLVGDKSAAEVTVPSGIENFYLLPSGPIPPSPAELLSSSRLLALFAELRRHYDCIIIDSAPVLGLADSPGLSALADGVVLVIEANRGRGGQLKAAIRRLRLMKPTILGAVLTKFDPDVAGNAYSTYYQYDYYQYRSDSHQ